MRLPEFAAESSLYRTSGHYQMAAGFNYDKGITPQGCSGPCYLDDSGNCVQDCIRPCKPGQEPNGCPYEYTKPCSPSKCKQPPPTCTCTTTRCCNGNCSTSSPVSC
jgi:hypothetical protein